MIWSRSLTLPKSLAPPWENYKFKKNSISSRKSGKQIKTNVRLLLQVVEVDKARLLENIRQKAQKNEEKEQIMQFLEEKSYGIEPKKFEGNFVSSPYMKNLETRLNDICCDGEVKESIDDDKTQRNLNTFKNLK